MNIKDWVRTLDEPQYNGRFNHYIKHDRFPQKHKLRKGDMWICCGYRFVLDEIKMAYPTCHYYWTKTKVDNYDPIGKFIKGQ